MANHAGPTESRCDGVCQEFHHCCRCCVLSKPILAHMLLPHSSALRSLESHDRVANDILHRCILHIDGQLAEERYNIPRSEFQLQSTVLGCRHSSARIWQKPRAGPVEASAAGGSSGVSGFGARKECGWVSYATRRNTPGRSGQAKANWRIPIFRCV